MRQPLLFIFALALLAGCSSRTPQTALSGVSGSTDSVTTPSEVSANETTKPTTDEVVCKAIADYLGGDKSAVRFTEQAKRDLYESTWPEVQCSVEGLLDSPSSFKDLVVKRVGPGLYKYECVCPDHGDRYVDCCTLSANVASDGVVEIEAVTWDNAVESFAALLDKAKWTKTEFNFKVPDLMTPSSEIWVDDVPASVNRWDYEDVCLACWPLLGTWAVTDYPEKNAYLTEKVKVKTITYSNGDNSVFSGYADDGRIWYMKKKLTKGGEVVHAKILVLLYPPSLQSDVKELIGVVKGW